MDNRACATVTLLAKGIDDSAAVPSHPIKMTYLSHYQIGVAAMREIGGRLAVKSLAALA